MKTTTITPTLTQLTRMRFVNAFLVREDDGFTLVDTTMGGAADDLITAAKALDGDVRRVAMTHGHGDHVGSMDAIKERLGDAVEVLVPEADARILAGEKDGKLPGSWPKVKTAPDTRLNPGDRVGSLEVVASPGHTPGHVAFLDTRDRTLIGGDVFTAYGSLHVTSHFYLRFPFATMATWDRAKDVESARSLREIDPAILVVGHGPATPEPAAAMEEAIARAQRSAR
jgi:glyoxylase-like metal-dependent hydrolase (beta-lactamase superfamily II)